MQMIVEHGLQINLILGPFYRIEVIVPLITHISNLSIEFGIYLKATQNSTAIIDKQGDL